MGLLQFNSPGISSIPITSSFNYNSKSLRPLHLPNQVSLERRKLFAISTNTTSGGSESTDVASEEPASIDFAFVNVRSVPKSLPIFLCSTSCRRCALLLQSKLLPDGTPDVQYRSACGGQKLRDIMLDNNIDLYGPYDGPLLNCSGGGTCGTCIVEVVEGKEILSLRTDKEKELLKKKPKTWRLACQTMVGNKDSRGQIIIQQLPEWKVHEWEK
ncbi:hypothetical protein C4D60_Mb11t04380 [Musa balbisiana]|uniref:2Fe-2S ferredoxin-type domain-containing protein n=1 Tax=Musa balbisiana TaxID=52838 RepID=A0A4S8J1M5_MUSBA|nr:hypothetical protein C4D60_Mb11t04380 [Musa balbisiana]